jgi:hypothetical protein
VVRARALAPTPSPRYRFPGMPLDTDERARAAQVAVLRRLGPEERLRIAVEMSEDARRIAVDAERRRHPELSEAAAWQAVFRRMWGAELADRVRWR